MWHAPNLPKKHCLPETHLSDHSVSDVVFPCQCLDCGAGISLAFCNAIASHFHSSLQTTSCNCSSALSQILCCHPTPSTTPAAATLPADDFLRVVAGRIPGWKDYNTYTAAVVEAETTNGTPGCSEETRYRRK